MGLFSYKEKRYGKFAFRLFAIILIVMGGAAIFGGYCALKMSHWSKYIILAVAAIVGLCLILFGLYLFLFSFSLINSWKSGRDGNKSKGVSNARLCDKCGKVISKKATFCEHCGAKQQSGLGMKTCPECKTKNSAKADFCEKCGHKFDL